MKVNPRQSLPSEERLQKLESENRTLRRCGIVVVVVIGAVLLMGQAAPKRPGMEQKLISTEKLVLTDAKGHIRAFFVADDKGARIVLQDSQGRPKIGLLADDEGEARIYINGEGDRSFATLGAHNISLADEPSGKIVSMRILSGGAGFGLSDNDKLRASFILLPDGPLLALYHKSGDKGARLSYTDNGPSLELEDAQGYTAIVGSSGLVTPHTGESHQTSAASLLLFDKEKNVIWKAP